MIDAREKILDGLPLCDGILSLFHTRNTVYGLSKCARFCYIIDFNNYALRSYPWLSIMKEL